MQEEVITEVSKDNQGRKNSINLIVAAFIPIILMILGFFIGIKFISPRFTIGSGNIAKVQLATQDTSVKEIGVQQTNNIKEENKNSVDYELGTVLANPAGTEGRRFAKVTVIIEVRTKSLLKELEKERSRLLHHLIILLSSKTIEELTSAEGKMLLQDEIKQKFANEMNWANSDICNIYFTEFIIQ